MPRFRLYLALLAACAVFMTCLSGCHSSVRPDARSEQRSAKTGTAKSQRFLTKTQAQQRKSIINKVSYDVYLDLSDEKASGFSGRTSIYMELQKADKPLTLDFQQGQIHRLLINSQNVAPDYNDQFLTLPRKNLKVGENIVEIEFSHAFSNSLSNSLNSALDSSLTSNDTGLTTFADPVDGHRYVYSQPGIYSTSQITPVFDQPDIKASFKLTTKVPSQWQVVTQNRERQAVGGGAERWWYFPETRPISPGAFSIQAGPFKVWQDNQENFPLRLMLRQSLSEPVDSRLLFENVQKARSFYQQFLEQPYPYFKYDIVALPVDSSFSNLSSASLLLDEKTLLPQATQNWPETRQRLFEHLASSWAGGSTSVIWWDEQWLMDGLAKYLSYLALASASETTRSDSWSMFYNQVKHPAYFFDQLPAAQPLRQSSGQSTEQSTEQLQAILESSEIKAGKSAAIVQLLHHNLGDDAFRQALQQFLQQYADNTTSAHTFFEKLQSASGQPLKNWEKQWLDTTGVQTIRAEYQCKEGMLHKLQIHQIEPRKRSQLLHVGLFKSKQSLLQRYRTLPVLLDGKTTRVDIPGQQPCPDFVYPNVDDKGYVNVQLDAQSLQTAIQGTFNESLMQTAVLHHLYSQSASIKSIIKYVTSRLPDETDVYTLKNQLAQLKQFSDQLLRLKSSTPAVQTISGHWLLSLEEFAWQQLNISEPDSPQQNLWFDFFLHIAHTDEGALQLRNLLDGRWDISGLDVNQSQRWKIIIKLNAFFGKSARKSWDYARRELQKDQSADAQLMYQLADASRPDTLVKGQWLLRMENLSGHEAEAISQILFPAMQYQLVPALRQGIFTMLLNRRAALSKSRFDQLVSNLLNECSVNGIKHLETFSHNKALSDNQLLMQAQIQRAKDCQQLPKTTVFK